MTQTAAGPRPPRTRATTMRAAVLVEPGRFEMIDAPLPTPAAGEVRVRVEGCGVCASNLPPFEGREWFTYPMAPGQLGHEAWGVVDAVGDGVGEFRVGARVAFLSNHAYAEYDVAPASQAIALPTALDGQPFPAEPLGCAVNIFARSGITRGQTVAIVGVGFLGALLTQMATRAGARVIAVAHRPYAQRVARRMGAADVVAMDDHWAIIEHVKSLTGGAFCGVVVECVGKEWPLNLSAELSRERGRLVIAGYHQDGLRSVNVQLWNWRGLDVINAHERDPLVYVRGMRDAACAVADGTLDPSSLFTHAFALEELGTALAMTADRPDGFMKALIAFGGGGAMRVLMTADTVGGVWTYAVDLARALASHGVEIVLATMGATPRVAQLDQVTRLGNVDLRPSTYKLEWMDEPWADVARAGDWLLELESETAPDVVHLNGYAHAALPFAAPRACVAHSCVLSWWRAVKDADAPAAPWRRNRDEVTAGLHAAESVVAPTRAMLDEMLAIYGTLPRSRVIHNGRDPSAHHAAKKEPFVLCAGRLWDESKNVRALAAAAERLPWPVYVAGDDRHPDGTRRRCDHVTCLGALDESTLAEWFGRASIYALPARYEPFGLSALEAALSGCALVLGDLPTLREVWRDAALYVPPGDADAIAAAVASLAADAAARESLGRRALQRASLYTAARMADEYVTLYRSLARDAVPA